jgi:lipoprotein-anchoring transpeptidase ErfK/SrfK/peptidoglycan hydrolase-like protein with peptidoglycan-binding domain
LRNGRKKGKAARAAAKRASSTFVAGLSFAAIAVAVATAPVQAKDQQTRPDDSGIADGDSGERLFLVISTGSQKVDVYRGTSLLTTSQVSTGMPAHPTFLGAFSIIEKQRWHHSNIYSGAPMPWMNRITWSGTALHAGVVPGYPASHGCIRLPYSFAPKLYQITRVGDNVVISHDRPVPALIEHPALFQPLPPPAPPVMVKQEQPPQRQSTNDIVPVLAPSIYPGMLAKADVSGVTTDIPSSIEAEAVDQGGHASSAPVPVDLNTGNAAAAEDTHIHAIDPYVGGAAAGSDTHASDTLGTHKDQARLKGSSGDTSRHALDDEDEDNESSVAKVPTSEPPIVATNVAKEAIVVVAPAPAEQPAITVTGTASPMAAPASATASVALAVPPQAPAPAQSVEAITPTAPLVPVAVTPLMPAPSQPSAQPAPDAPPSMVATKLMAGTSAAAIQAAEPRSNAPLRILVTRRTQRDRIIAVQNILADLGYLDHQDFDGTFGKPTVTAIKAFQKANGMPETGAFTQDLVKKVYEVAGKGEPPLGHIYVRQEFSRVFDAPVGLRNPDEPLGTHVYTALKFAPGDTKTRWMAVTVQGGSAESALDRIEIPDDIRQRISERLTPGSTLIIGDTSINAATLPKGGDFVVLAKGSPGNRTVSSGGDADQPRKKIRRYNYNYGYSYPRPFQQPQRTYRSFPGWPF